MEPIIEKRIQVLCGSMSTVKEHIEAITKWLNENADLYAKVPYLSAYMGHTQFEDTAYYIHLLPEKLLSSSAVDWSKFSSLIPEVKDDDE